MLTDNLFILTETKYNLIVMVEALVGRQYTSDKDISIDIVYTILPFPSTQISHVQYSYFFRTSHKCVASYFLLKGTHVLI